MKKFRLGILGPGRIANKFAQSIPYSEQEISSDLGFNLKWMKSFGVYGQAKSNPIIGHTKTAFKWLSTFKRLRVFSNRYFKFNQL